MNDCPVIVCAADNRYAMPLAVMLRSLAENLKRYPQVSVWVLDGGVSRRNKRRVAASLPDGKVKLHWVRPSHQKLKNVPVFGHVSICTYYRLLMGELLPSALSKVVYLDVDTLVLGDIGELWDKTVSPNVVLAFAEEGCKVSDPYGLSMYRELGMNPDELYFNAGVLLIDLDLWRRGNLGAECLAFIDKYATLINFWDQDALNGVLVSRWGGFDKKWNSRVHHEWAKDQFSREVGGMAVIHFASSVKPWMYGAKHAAEALYYSWLDKTVWAGWRPKKPLVNWSAIRRSVGNKYWYGKWFRKMPLVGRLWAMRGKWHASDAEL
jgi:lipopolysaccharide biosynthesis glycosyltransferase